jgi:hypothetical protein
MALANSVPPAELFSAAAAAAAAAALLVMAAKKSDVVCALAARAAAAAGGYVLPLVAVVPCDGAGTLHHAGLLVGLGIVVETAAVEGEEGAKFKH